MLIELILALIFGIIAGSVIADARHGSVGAERVIVAGNAGSELRC